MSGDTSNVALWQNADVYIDTAMTGAVPADVTAAWGTGWAAVGLLDGDAGLVESRDEKSDEFYAWGSILVKKTKTQQKRTIKFAAMEDNPVVFALVNPGSASSTDGTSGITTRTIKVPENVDFAIGFEVRDGDKVKRRVAKRATISAVDDITESESDVTVYTLTVLIYPEADGTLFHEVEGTVA